MRLGLLGLLGLLGVFIGLFLVAGAVHVWAQGPIIAGDKSRFIRDVTYEDGASLGPGQEIDKEWEIQNIGTVRWTKRWLRATKSSAGAADLKAIKPVKVPDTAPGQHCHIRARLVAPRKLGMYRVDFKMTDAKGKILLPNQQPLYILVVVAR